MIEYATFHAFHFDVKTYIRDIWKQMLHDNAKAWLLEIEAYVI